MPASARVGSTFEITVPAIKLPEGAVDCLTSPTCTWIDVWADVFCVDLKSNPTLLFETPGSFATTS